MPASRPHRFPSWRWPLAGCLPEKAIGEDGVPAELLRAAPAEVAAALHPLAAKVALYAAEPVVWKKDPQPY
eukprot:5115483-Alexandrium_andersonii.AAC.1